MLVKSKAQDTEDAVAFMVLKHSLQDVLLDPRVFSLDTSCHDT